MLHLIWYIVVGLSCRVCCEIRHAYARDTTLDGSARNRRFNCGRMCNSHVFAAEGRRPISSGRYYLLDTWRASRFVCLQ